MHEGLRSGEPLSTARFAEVVDRAANEAFKWNVTEDGVTRLCDFPLLLSAGVWQSLSAAAVRLANEAEAAERELVARPFLRSTLGIPLALQLALRQSQRAPSLRHSRFDFHPTRDGRFVITEGNLDVAGGWNEAGGVTAAFSEHVHEARPAGDPAAVLAAALVARIGAGGTIGLMHLTRYTDDHQVARYLAQQFERQGLAPIFFDPTQLRSVGERAAALVGDRPLPLAAVFRFFPAEWSCRLGRRREWFRAHAQPSTVWSNPLSTVLTQSKRFALSWPALSSPVSTWAAHLPETRNPTWVRGSAWVLKPALGHEGFQVTLDGVTEAPELDRRWRQARRRPWRWVAQRRFEPLAIATPHGPRYPCIGVYVVDGTAAGIYGRVAARPLIDAGAQDAVVLVRA